MKAWAKGDVGTGRDFKKCPKKKSSASLVKTRLDRARVLT